MNDEAIVEETIKLPRMVCLSTEETHGSRVPPTVHSVREAICWLNWGVDSEEFAVQT